MEAASCKNTLAPLGRGKDPLTKVSGRVRGHPRSRQFRQNRGKNPVHVADDVLVPEAKRFISARQKERVSPFIFQHTFRMLPTVSFNHKTMFNAQKIGNIRANRHLPTKLRIAQLTISQTRPKQSLCMSLVSPERTSTNRIPLFHTPSPHPSPLRGAGVHRQNTDDNRS